MKMALGQGINKRGKMTNWHGKIICMIGSFSLMLCITGCGTAVIKLTDSEEALISEYAAELIMDYSGIHKHKIVKELVEQREEEMQKEEPFVEDEVEELMNSQDQISMEENFEVVSGNHDFVVEESEYVPDMTIEEFFNIPGVNIIYKGYELADSYPEDSEDEFYFSVDATSGTKLLVLKFDIANVTSEDLALDMLNYNMKFKIGVNDEAGKWALSTMLLNDLGSYVGTIPVGSYNEGVLLIEIPQDINVESITLFLKKGEESLKKKLL